MFEALRWRLTAWYVAAFAIVAIAVGVIVFFWVDRRLSHDVDLAMRGVSDSAVAAVEKREASEAPGSGVGLGEEDVRGVLAAASLGRSADVFVLLLNPDGSVAANPGDLPLTGLPQQASFAAAAGSGDDWRSARVDGHDVRIRTVAVRDAAGATEGYVQAGKSLQERDESLRTLALVMAGGGLAGLVLATAGGLVVAGIAIRPVRRSFVRQREFVADASHELRTPLTVIRTNAEALAVTLPADDALDDIAAESAYMTRLLDDLLTLAGSDQEGIDLVTSRFSLAEVARGVASAGSKLSADAGLTFRCDVVADSTLTADAERCREVMLILVDNAVKYTPRGGSVAMRIDQDRTDAIVEVRDTGIGIAPDDLPRLFDRFYRVDKARSRMLGGAGLGLSIAREIVDAHGGSIAIASEAGEGTVVTMRLPRDADAAA